MVFESLTQNQVAIDILKTIVITVAVISSIVFVALFGRLPIFRKTPIGWTNRLLLVHLPNGLLGIDGIITGGRFSSCVIRFSKYVMSGRHPIVLVIFVLLQLVSEVLWIPPALPYLTSLHLFLLLPLAVTLPYLSLYLSTTTISHHINPTNYAEFLRSYPYDYILYHPHQPCRTCSSTTSHHSQPLPPSKPARSKHCPICDICIARMDHHCIWINNCVGQSNYHYFIAVLVSISMLLAYGSITGFSILDTLAQKRFVPASLTLSSVTAKKWSTGLTWTAYLERFSLVIAFNARIGATTLLASMSLPLALGFLVYHAYLIWAGMTTNETQKWADLREDIWDGLVWKAPIEDMKAEYPGPLDEKIVYDAQHHASGGTSRAGRAPDWAGGRKGNWWVIRVRPDTMPLRRMILDGREVDVLDERFSRVKDLREVVNLYDLGWWENLKDALFGHRILRG